MFDASFVVLHTSRPVVINIEMLHLCHIFVCSNTLDAGQKINYDDSVTVCREDAFKLNHPHNTKLNAYVPLD
jgi:hypothetical protein